ncbi:translocase of the inner membrane [Quaeritorhiza haematococci]|nr:translocase of the inner membrane [Quaeritorhiza haematococci]
MSHDPSRDPCPYSVVNDVGIGFSMGAIGGAAWHGFKGYRNSPRNARFAGLVSMVKARAPVTGGNFAVWSGMFNAGDCIIAGIRGKEDPWNAIMAGAATGGLLAARSGPRAMAASAIVGGIILAVMEGVAVMINRASADAYKPQAPVLPEGALPPNMTIQDQIAPVLETKEKQVQQQQQQPSSPAPTTVPMSSPSDSFKADEPQQQQAPFLDTPKVQPAKRGLFF